MKSILKWLAAAGGAGLAVGLKAFLAKLGVTSSGADPLIDLVLIAAAGKLVAWLVSKLPAE